MVRLDVDTESGVLIPGNGNYVEVLFAKNLSEADNLRRILEAKSIPALTERNMAHPVSCGVAVLVPVERLVDASEVLTKMAHDDEDDDFVIEDDDDEADDEFEDDDDLDLDDDDSEFGDDDDELDEEEEEI
jgi:hypothetical protein